SQDRPLMPGIRPGISSHTRGDPAMWVQKPCCRMLLLLSLLSLPAVAGGTESQAQGLGDRAREVPVNESPLERPARLRIERASLENALTLLESRAGISLIYSPSRLPRREVSCQCYSMPVSQALDEMLVGLALRYSVMGDHVILEPQGRPSTLLPSQPGTILASAAPIRPE